MQECSAAASGKRVLACTIGDRPAGDKPRACPHPYPPCLQRQEHHPGFVLLRCCVGHQAHRCRRLQADPDHRQVKSTRLWRLTALRHVPCGALTACRRLQTAKPSGAVACRGGAHCPTGPAPGLSARLVLPPPCASTCAYTHPRPYPSSTHAHAAGSSHPAPLYHFIRLFRPSSECYIAAVAPCAGLFCKQTRANEPGQQEDERVQEASQRLSRPCGPASTAP